MPKSGKATYEKNRQPPVTLSDRNRVYAEALVTAQEAPTVAAVVARCVGFARCIDETRTRKGMTGDRITISPSGAGDDLVLLHVTTDHGRSGRSERPQVYPTFAPEDKLWLATKRTADPDGPPTPDVVNRTVTFARLCGEIGVAEQVNLVDLQTMSQFPVPTPMNLARPFENVPEIAPPTPGETEFVIHRR